MAWSRRLAVVSLNAGEIYVSGDEFRENGWPRGKNVDFSPRIYPSGRWMLQNEKGKDVYSRSQNIFICRDVIPLFRDKWRPISVKNRFLRTCSFFSNVRKLTLSRLFDRLAFTGYGARLEINGIRMCPK